jgi:hypothetical protein
MISYLQSSLNFIIKGVTKKEHEGKQAFSKLQNAENEGIFFHLDLSYF